MDTTTEWTPAQWRAIQYLDRIGPRSNLNKIRAELEVLGRICRGTDAWSTWNEARSSVSELLDDPEIEPEIRQGMRDELEGEVEDLLHELNA